MSAGQQLSSKSLLGIAVGSGAGAPFLAFTMGRGLGALSLLPALITAVGVVVGITIGLSHGVDWLGDLLGVSPEASGVGQWLRRAGAWLGGLVLGLVAGLQVALLLSLPLLDRLALAVERHEGWTAPGRGLGLLASAFSVSMYMVAWLGGAAVFFALGLIPVIGIAFVVVGWLWSALCLALDAVDPTLCRAGLGIGKRIALVLRHPVPFIAFGALASLWAIIPGSYPGIVVGGSRLASRVLMSEAKDRGLESTP